MLQSTEIDSACCHDQDELDSDLLAAIADLLGLEPREIQTQPDLTFIQLGGNSAKALELTFRLDAVGKVLDIETVLDEESTIQILSQRLVESLDESSDSEWSETSHDSETAAISTPESVDTDPSNRVSSLLPPGLKPTSAVKDASEQIGCSADHIEDILPTTSQQKALWLGSLKARGSYITHWCFKLSDDVDLPRLHSAWREVLQTTPALRTRVVLLSDDVLCQAILRNSYYHRQQSTQEFSRYQRVIADHGAPLFEFGVETRGKARRFHIFAHHAIYDRWSMHLILDDVRNAYYTGEAPRPRPSYLPFLRPLKENKSTELRREWWAAIGEEPIVSAPLLKRPESSAHASKVLQLSAPAVQSSRVTRAELVTAAWSLVCSRHCNSARVSFGLTLWGRDLPVSGVKEMAFPTFTTLPFCTQVSEDHTVSAFLSRIKADLSFVRRMQQLSVDEISGLGPTHRAACLFNSILVIQQEHSQQSDADRSLFDPQTLLSFESIQSDPIVLECTPTKTDTIFKMRYDPAYIPTIEAETMLSHLKTAFEALCSDTDQPVDHVSLFSEHDRRQVTKWVKPSIPCKKATLYSLIEEQVSRRPNSTAVWQTDLSLTYQTLLEYSRKVMINVLAANDKHSPNIGVCFEKSAFAVVSMLGISMSGYCFVPMDASNPFNRLMQLVTDAGMELVVCSRTMAPQFQKENIRTMIVDEESLSDMVSPAEDTPAPHSNVEANVYIIYTSGSTGKPKGVVMTHQALCTTLDAISKHLEFTEDTRSLQFSSFAFDMSVHDIWCTLMTGGVVCIPTETERFELDDFLSRAKCNYAMLTPSVALTLSNQSWRSFEKLSVAGEPLPKAVFLSALENGVKFWNTYGPTESCIVCLTEQIKTKNTSPLRLGYSVAATGWIIDVNNPHALAPVGCIGELALTGHTLADGYYQDVAKTKKAFAEGLEWTKMFPDHPLKKVYRTGDLARYNNDGSIEFVGRVGGYIKIAGNRVDLGEIEFVLHSQCGLPKVSVQYCKVGTTDSRDLLVSFCAMPSDKVTADPEVLPLTKEMRAKATEGFTKLRDLLPVYMMPRALVPINRFPYSTAGKLDKKVLIGLIENENVDDIIERYGINAQDNDSPETTQEEAEQIDKLSSSVQVLRDCWAAVLKLTSASISPNSHFFKLGGDSLRAMSLGAQVRKAGHLLRVSDVFRYPVLTDMAGQIQEAKSKDAHTDSTDSDTSIQTFWSADENGKLRKAACDKLQVREEQIESLLPCSPLQIQMLVGSARSQGSYLHIECFKLRTDTQLAEVKSICQDLVKSNEILRSSAFVDEQSGRFVLVILQPDRAVELKQEQCNPRKFVESSQRAALGIDAALCRFSLLGDGQDRYLVWEMHHSIFDGYSNILLLERMRAAIELYREDTPSAKLTKHEPTAKFEAFVKYIDGADKEKGQEFWSTYLHDATKLNLSLSGPKSSQPTTDARVTKDVNIAWNRSTITTATYIRAAFALMLSQCTASSDVVFCATNNGRDLPVMGIEEMAGPTFSTLPVRCRINRKETLGDLFSRVQLEAAEIASHQYLSTEEISRMNNSCKQACQFDVHLLVQSAASEPPYQDLTDLGYERLPDLSPMSLQIPFNLVATARADSIHLEVIYNKGKHPSGQVHLLLDQFVATLNQILTANEDTMVSEIHDLGEENRDMLLSIQPSGERHVEPTNSTIPDLIFSKLDERGENQALYSTESALTYREMYELTSALSQQIVLTIGHSHRFVAVCYEKSTSTIIAQLAVLMAGHAYVSIDPSWPISRKQNILEQINCPLVVSSDSNKEMAQELKINSIVFDDGYVTIPGGLKKDQRVQPDDAAYVIFTSGSTGTPKGVVVEHRSICRTLLTYAERLKFTKHTRALLFASFSFDASIMETWSVLAAGGTLCIADEKERISDLDGFVSRSKADCIGLTPTAAMLVDAERHDHIKTLLFCGEKCQPKDLQRWTKNNIVLVNAYGPSEASVNAVMNTKFRNTDLDNIGHSMGGGLWIVDPDDHDCLLPVGASGELLISGPVLAREYLNDPEKTSQKFVYPDWPSWTGMQGQRAYKTGDLVRLDLEGTLHFVGRHDGQMKINGVRVEADEIESMLQKYDVDIKEAIAGTYAADGSDINELALYFVPSSAADTSGSDVHILPLQKDHLKTMSHLCEALKRELPRSSVPTVYIPVSAIPKMASNKRDRKLLPQLASFLHPSQIDLFRPATSRSRHRHRSPSRSRSRSSSASSITTRRRHSTDSSSDSQLTPTETTLQSLWFQTLHLPASTPITRHSHFTQLGGNSISAIRLSGLARSHDIELPVGTIYANPILGEMARAVDATREAEGAKSELVTPAPFELVEGLEISPILSRTEATVKGQGDYFGDVGGVAGGSG